MQDTSIRIAGRPFIEEDAEGETLTKAQKCNPNRHEEDNSSSKSDTREAQRMQGVHENQL